MKSPAVIHLKCLDTFALRGVARSFGAGAAGVRLTHEGLETHARPSRRRRGEPAREPEGQTTEAPSEREASADTLVPHATPILLPLPSVPRLSMPSHVTLEMGLRRPTTWAVLLLSLGVSFGVVIARVASESVALEPRASNAAVVPPNVVEAVLVPRTTRAPLPPPGPSPSPFTIASTTIVGRHHAHSHHAAGASAQAKVALPPPEVAPPEPEIVPPTPAASASLPAVGDPTKIEALEEKSDGGDVASAAAASEQARRELSDSLGASQSAAHHPTAR